VLGGDEPDAPSSWRFSIDVARAWERAFDEAAAPRTRKGHPAVSDDDEPGPGRCSGYASRACPAWLGGKSGAGRQFVSWIHYEDFVRAVRWLIDHDAVGGVVNVAAPNPLPNAEFMRLLRGASGTSVGLPASRLDVGSRAPC
jgi:NAD dependent epimerase/dehydratase family enzyme